MTTLLPGGNSGVLLKSKGPSNSSYADNFGCNLDFLSRFKVILDWVINLSHKCKGKRELVLLIPDKK